MSTRFILSSLAAEDLDQILTYVLEHSSPARAQHVADRLEEAFLKLADRCEGRLKSAAPGGLPAVG